MGRHDQETVKIKTSTTSSGIPMHALWDPGRMPERHSRPWKAVRVVWNLDRIQGLDGPALAGTPRRDDSGDR